MANQSIEQVLITKQAMSLYQSKKITIHEALMLSIITALDNEKGCFATNRYFADNLPFEIERVKEIIKSLVKKGYVKSTMIDNNTKRILNVVSKSDKQPKQSIEVEATGSVKQDSKQQCKPVHKHQEDKKQGHISKKAQEWCAIDIHNNWDWDEIAMLEMQLINKRLGAG